MFKKNIWSIVFWGALWGLEEASLGHILHIIPFNIGWFFWFPLAFFFINMVYKQTGKLNSIIITSFVAAGIKLTNLLLTSNIIIVICPVLSILFEGLAVFSLSLLFRKKYLHINEFFSISAMSLLWRTAYTLSILAIPAFIMPSYPYKNLYLLLKFICFEGLINSLSVYLTMISVKKLNDIKIYNYAYSRLFYEKIVQSNYFKELSYKPHISISMLIIALIIQWIV